MARPNSVKAYSGPHSTITKLADGAITEASVVTKGTNSEDVAEAVAGDAAIGVAASDSVGTDQYEDGDQVDVITSGVVKVEANAAIAPGEAVATDASGKVKPAAAVVEDGTGAAGGYDLSKVVGTAVSEATASGDIVEVQL